MCARNSSSKDVIPVSVASNLAFTIEGQSSPVLAYCLLVCLLSGVLCTSALAAGASN